jgi:hypothetical protein
MHLPKPAAVALVALLVGAACGFGTSSGLTAADLKKHPEATLDYPGSHSLYFYLHDEEDKVGWTNLPPSPAYSEIEFSTSDRPDRVVAWYEAFLDAHGWQDTTIQGDGYRYWVRGRSEDFNLSCRSQAALVCDAWYTLRSSQFKGTYTAAPRLGDPVSLAAVQQRRIGLRATQTSLDYMEGKSVPVDGSPEASIARSEWATKTCCAVPVIMLDQASAEQSAPSLSAYHLVVVQVAEYDARDELGNTFPIIPANEKTNLSNSGFVLENTGYGKLGAQDASAFVFMRGLREAMFFTIAYGPLIGTLGLKYRIATVRFIYAVAPASCLLSTPGCFKVLFGAADAVWLEPPA